MYFAINMIKELEDLIRNQEGILSSANECKINIEKSIYDTEQYLIMYKNRIKELKQ